MELFIFGFLSLGSVWFFAYFARRTEPNGPQIIFQRFQLPDAILASLLGLFFLWLTYAALSQTKQVEITTAVLVDNALFSFVLVGGVLMSLALRSLNPVDVFGLRRFTWKQAARSLLILAVALPAVSFAHAIVMKLMGDDGSLQPLVQFLIAPDTAPSDRLLLIFTAVIVAPISEEVIFRGYFYGVIRRYGGRWVAIILSSALFAAIHAHAPSFAALMVLAFALTLVYEQTGSLWAPMLMHTCFNSLTVANAFLWPAAGN